MTHDKRPGALDGLKIIDLTRVLAGPFCTMMLGDMGAEIIKIENPDGGDDTRGWPPFYEGGESSYFQSVNRNKKSLTLDLKSDEGKKILREFSYIPNTAEVSYFGLIKSCNKYLNQIKSPDVIFRAFFVNSSFGEN